MPRWLLWTLLAIACWGVWAVIPTEIGTSLSAQQQQALCTIGLLPLLCILPFQREPASSENKRRGRWISLAAGVCSSLGNIPYFDLLSRGENAATVVPLAAMYPLVTVLLAVVLLRERLNVVQLLGLVLSMAAIYLFNVSKESESGLINSWLLAAMIPIGLWGTAGLLQKLATNYVGGAYSALWFHLAFIPIGLILYWREPLTAAVSLKHWALVLTLGLTLALGNLAVLAAFASGGRAAIITPLAGLYPLISLPIALWYFNNSINQRQGLGIAFALLAVAMLTYEPAAKPAPLAEPATDTLA
ncbi:MAG: DMT family transporter [Planctomycetia bacterium]|nr:DMT family transporter [Planctomycetia bacterium]